MLLGGRESMYIFFVVVSSESSRVVRKRCFVCLFVVCLCKFEFLVSSDLVLFLWVL